MLEEKIPDSEILFTGYSNLSFNTPWKVIYNKDIWLNERRFSFGK